MSATATGALTVRHFEGEPGRRAAAKLLTRDEAAPNHPGGEAPGAGARPLSDRGGPRRQLRRRVSYRSTTCWRSCAILLPNIGAVTRWRWPPLPTCMPD